MNNRRRLHRYRPLIIGGALVLGALEMLALQRSRRQRRRAGSLPRTAETEALSAA
jgi:hypothetical protein